MAGATTCPECGARVSAFAAGCATCGADLEAHARRARLEAETVTAPGHVVAGRRLPRLGAVPRPALSVGAWLYLAAMAFFLPFVPALALLLAVLGVMHGFYEGQPRWIALCAAVAAAALALELAGLLGSG